MASVMVVAAEIMPAMARLALEAVAVVMAVAVVVPEVVLLAVISPGSVRNSGHHQEDECPHDWRERLHWSEMDGPRAEGCGA
mmetsp:Transcript_97203/g.258322  ORF Transcript_97203/g.258322 Transcript_97203/m.258322 type:complete len:82 (+) Transcript_97203:745-990(+)